MYRTEKLFRTKKTCPSPWQLLMNYDVFTMYYSDKISFFLCSNSSIRSNTQSWNYEFWIFSRKWMGLFSNIWKLAFLVKINQRVNFENLFWANQNKQQNSGSVDLGLGVAFDETVIKKPIMPSPSYWTQGGTSIHQKKTEKNGKKEPYLHIFLQIHIFSQICFYFEDPRKKEKWLILTK